MKVTITYDFPGVDPNSDEATEILDAVFDRVDLMRLADETGARSVTLDDIAGDEVFSKLKGESK